MRKIASSLLLLLVAPFAFAEKAVLLTTDTIQPFGVDFDKDGKAYFIEMNGGDRLRMLNTEGKPVTLAGTGKKGNSGDGADDPLKAEFNGMHNLAIAPDGKFFLADSFNNTIRIYDPAIKKLTAFAGTGKKGNGGDDGPAAKAEFSTTICIALTADGKTLYVADIGNKRVRAIDVKTGIVSNFAGNGKAGVPKDGEPAKEQPLVDPRAVSVDAKGNVYILERGGNALRVVGVDGKIKTVAGTGMAGNGGNGGPALQAKLKGPKFISIDRDGSVLIADTENHELVAGSGTKGKGVDPDPKKLEMNRPHGIVVHPKTGELFICDSDNNRILKIIRD
jgi:DNA-binding beta-propeller fold protein YncE